MSKDNDFQGSPASIFWFAFSAFLALMAIAHGAAFLMQHVAPVEDVFYYRVIFAIQASILLLTPALCFHIFSHSDARNSYWRAFWTVAYLALLVRLYWSFVGSCGGSIDAIFDQIQGRKLYPGCFVEHTRPDTFLAAWWGLDLILAWSLREPSNGCAFSEARSICWHLRCFLEPLCSQTRSKSAYGCLAS